MVLKKHRDRQHSKPESCFYATSYLLVEKHEDFFYAYQMNINPLSDSVALI